MNVRLLYLVLLTSCATRALSVEVEAGTAFDLGLSEVVRIAGVELRVRFDAVPEDSRCPPDVQCVWAGNARVRLLVTPSADDPVDVLLNTHGGTRYPRQACAFDYAFELKELRPGPRSSASRDGGAPAYRATLVVSEDCAAENETGRGE